MTATITGSAPNDCESVHPLGWSPRRVSAAAAASAPGAPLQFIATATGARVSLSWQAPLGGEAATSYVVEAGSASGRADLANFDTGSAAPSLSVDGVAAGTYFVRVRSKNSAGVSAPSNEVALSVGATPTCFVIPIAPLQRPPQAFGAAVTLIWAWPQGVCPPVSYTIEAGSAPGLSNLAVVRAGSTTSFSANGLSAGTYYVRVRAVFSDGSVSPASNEVSFSITGAVSSFSYTSTPDFQNPSGRSGSFTTATARFAVSESAFNRSVSISIQSPIGDDVILDVATRYGTPLLEPGTYEVTPTSVRGNGPYLFSQVNGVPLCFSGFRYGRFVIHEVTYAGGPVPTSLHMTFEQQYCDTFLLRGELFLRR